MKNRILKLVTIFMIIITPLQILAAGNGTVKGVVLDDQTGTPLPGATVVIMKNYLATTTNLEGEFVLNNVPAGSNIITIKYVGYKSQDISVEVLDRQTSTIEVSMIIFAIQGEEVVITTQARGQRAAINQQLASTTISNVVSSEKMKELPDANAAEAIGRLPGVSLQRASGEASKIVLRGLAPQYTNVTIEGVKMSSTGGDRSADLSLVQGDVLSGIEVSKSLKADMDADALGGTVNLRLSKAPEKPKADLMIEGGYAHITRNTSNFKTAGGISNRFFNKKLGVNLRGTYEIKQLPSHQYSGSYFGPSLEDTTYRLISQSYSLVDKSLSRKRSNATLIIDYSNDWWEAKFFNLLNYKDDYTINRSNNRIFSSSGNPQGVDDDFSKGTGEWFNNTLTSAHTFQNEFNFGASKINLDFSTTTAKVKGSGENFSFMERTGLYVDRPDLIDLAPLDIIQDYPDAGFESLDVDNSFFTTMSWDESMLSESTLGAKLDYEYTFSLFNAFSGKIKAGGKYGKNKRSNDVTSYYRGLQGGNTDPGRELMRNLFPNIISPNNKGYGDDVGLMCIDGAFADTDYSPLNFLNGRYNFGWGSDIDLFTEMQKSFRENGGEQYYRYNGENSLQSDYEAIERKWSAYLMSELNIGGKLTLFPGIRVEKVQTDYSAYQFLATQDATGVGGEPYYATTTRKNINWFPSLNAKFIVSDLIRLQGAVYKSTSRPSFSQISPAIVYKPEGDRFSSHNPYLEPSTAWNYDLGVSLINKKLGLFTIYGFYKEITDLIYTMNNYEPDKKEDIVGGPDDLDERLLGYEYYNSDLLKTEQIVNMPFNNPEATTIYGVEASWQTNFWYLPGVLKGLVLDINYTQLYAETSYPYFEQVEIGVEPGPWGDVPIYAQEYKTEYGVVYGQPKFIINVILGWDYKGFSGRVSYRNQAKTTNYLDQLYNVRNSYYDNFSLIDVMLKQNISKKLSVFANLTNIGNHVDDTYYEGEGRPMLMTNSQYYGMRAQVGVKLKY